MKLCRLTTWTSHTKLLAAGVLCLVLTATAGQAQAAYTEEGNYYPDYLEEYSEAKQITPLSTAYDEDLTTVTQNGITYKLDRTQKTAEVAGYTTDISPTCVIPASITDNGHTYSVVAIREGGLYNCSVITSLSIPEGVKTIGRNAVAGCTKLQTVSLPHSITYVGHDTFKDCTSLQAINVTNGNATYYSVDGVLFFKNSYEGSTELLKYPEGRADRSYTVPDGVSVISHRAFYHAGKIQKIMLPDSVLTIEGSAFEQCENLENIDFGNGLQTIGGESFSYCSSLKVIKLPSTLSELEGWNFLECSSLASIVVDRDNEHFFSDGVGLYENTENGIEFRLYAPASVCDSYTLQEGTTVISEAAFWGAENLKEIQLPEGLQEIKNGAFTQTGLTKLRLPKTVTVVGSYFCQSCANLKEISLGSIVKIPTQTLYYCWSLESITIPATVETIEKQPFTGCGALEKIFVEEGNANYCSDDDVLFNKEKTDLILYPAAKKEQTYIVPKSVAHIGYGVFQLADNLKEIEVEAENSNYYAEDGVLFERTGEQNSNAIIYEDAYPKGDVLNFGVSLHTFPVGKTLGSYTIPSGIKTVSPYAFFHNKTLQALDLNQVCYAGARAFAQTDIRTVECGNLSYIGDRAFHISQINHIVLSENLKEVGTQAFDYSDQLNDITFLGKAVPPSTHLLAYNCPSLRYVYVPDSEDGSIQADYVRSLAGNLRPGVMIVTGQYVPKEEVAKKVDGLSESSTKDEINQAAISLVRLTSDDVSQISNDDLKKVDGLFSETNGINVVQEAQGDQAKQVTVSGAAVASGLTEKIAQGEDVADKTVTVKIQEEVPQFGEVCRLNFTMLVEGEEKEPLTPVMVKLPKPQNVPEDMLYIFHFMDNGGVELVNYKMVGNEIEFRANSFSSYALLNMAEGASGVTYSVPDGQQAQLVIACYDASGKMTTCTMTSVRGNGSQAVDVQSGQTFQAFLLGEDNQPVGTVTIRDWRPSDETGEADQ